MKIIKRIKKKYTLLKKERNKYGNLVFLLRIPEAFLSGMYFLLVFGNAIKLEHFHRNINPIYKLRYKYTNKIHAKILDDFDKRFLKNNQYIFKDIIFPKIKSDIMHILYKDIFQVYVEYDDNYDYRIVDELDNYSPEGSYLYTNKEKGIDITIHENDVVLDAGAWAGDFSIYATKKGAKVYAFEPIPSAIKLLEKTITYNKTDNIFIVKYGLGDKKYDTFIKDEIGSTSNSILDKVDKGDTKISITTIDHFVKNNNITKLDFIKADIEGSERDMLRGAKETLKKLQPTLSICTYHLLDDPEILEKIILEANPNYKIIQRGMKLFAYIDNK